MDLGIKQRDIKQRDPIVIGCIYRHPKSNIELFTDQLEELLRYLNQRKYDVFILGDQINVNFYKFQHIIRLKNT